MAESLLKIKKKPNEDIKEYAHLQGVYLWQVAELCEVSEATLMRRLRTELTMEEKEDLKRIIDRIAFY